MEDTKYELRLHSGISILTAQLAFALVEPVVRLQDQEARLMFIRSDEPISHQGNSDMWWLTFLLPTTQAEMRCVIGFDPETDTMNHPHLVLFANTIPFALMEREAILRQLNVSLSEQWQRKMEQPELPVPFRDSTIAVHALAEQGIDFLSGNSSTVLSAEILPSGQAVWKVTVDSQEFYTPFVRASDV